MKFLKENTPFSAALILFLITMLIIILYKPNLNNPTDIIIYGGCFALNFFCLGAMTGYRDCYKRYRK